MIQDFLNDSKCHFCDNRASCFRSSLEFGFVIFSCVAHIIDLEELYQKLTYKTKKPYIEQKESKKT